MAETIWLVRSQPPQATIAWEVGPPGSGTLLAYPPRASSTDPMLRFAALGSGDPLESRLISEHGEELISRTGNSSKPDRCVWRAIQLPGPDGIQALAAFDSAAGKFRVAPAGQPDWSCDLAAYPLSPGTAAFERPRSTFGRDGLFYVALSPVDVVVLDSTGRFVRQSAWSSRSSGSTPFASTIA